MPPPTPVLVADAAALDANVAAMQALADAHGVSLRPHAKGHRAPWVAARQLAAGATGVAVATAAEARILLEAGVGDVLLTTIPAPGRAAELAALGPPGALTLVAHTPALVAVLAAAAADAGRTLRVLVDVDVGQRRGGAPTPEAALATAAAVAAAPTLELRGVQGYDGHLQGIPGAAARAAGHAEAMARLDAVVVALSGAGLAAPLVTTAGTATAALAAAHPSVTEIQPGSYALMDHRYAAIDGVAFTQAAFVLTSVTALIAPGEVIVDAGTRAVSTDLGAPLVAGRDATWVSAGDEHGRVPGDVGDLRPGDVLRLVPSHTDTTVVLHGAVVPA
ncbi:alanine racemase [Paraconexibacter antarcticus]|uniref:Alanine racemase n=1 Tax=Paraconexibacter antarcticus TaxID=2949664 RepID=A0ABY5DY94_9ACTN|nr:alanine racemase [Paraconexibacter antarcticus]UTI65529.1 alanine racemase [Paraconexibacter antarcticus]